MLDEGDRGALEEASTTLAGRLTPEHIVLLNIDGDADTKTGLLAWAALSPREVLLITPDDVSD